MDDEFDILAAKVLSGDATEDEEKRLRELLAKDPRLEAELDDLRATWKAMKEFGPLAEPLEPATGARAPEPPAERVKQWRATLAHKFKPGFDPKLVGAEDDEKQTPESGSHSGTRRRVPLTLLALAAVCIAAAVVAIFFVRRGGFHEPFSAPVAYLVPNEGSFEILRNGKAFAADSSAPLRETDEIRLLARTSATVITPKGSVSLQGPQTFATASLLNNGAGPGAETSVAQRLRTALFEPSSQLMGLITTKRGSQGIEVYCPAGFTARLTPVIMWRSEPGKTYDVSITDELAPLAATVRGRGELADSFSRSGVLSPLEFTNAWPKRSLARDGLYRLRISEIGNPFSAAELVFRTLPEANGAFRADASKKADPPAASSSPSASPLVAAYQTLTANPPRLGDALSILLTLPPEFGNSKLALRLKLFAFGQLGYQHDFEATLLQIDAANPD